MKTKKAFINVTGRATIKGREKTPDRWGNPTKSGQGYLSGLSLAARKAFHAGALLYLFGKSRNKTRLYIVGARQLHRWPEYSTPSPCATCGHTPAPRPSEPRPNGHTYFARKAWYWEAVALQEAGRVSEKHYAGFLKDNPR